MTTRDPLPNAATEVVTEAEFPRRVLMCTTGMSPQVVTETLYALAVEPQAGRPRWVPTEVHLISTRRGLEHARLNLLSETPGWFRRLCADYHLPAIAFPPEHLHPIVGAHGQALDDIRTPEENEATANAIASLVREIAQDPQAQLHVSIAGGRKTMGYYLGYALSLYGRPQDRLSHVLVSEPFESHPEFYYPTLYERVIHTRDPKNPVAVDCRDARVSLAEIPFVRLRDGLPQRLLSGDAAFTETVALANQAYGAVKVTVSLSERLVRVNDWAVRLGDPGFALYAWLAQRARNGQGAVNWVQQENWKDEFVPLVRRLFGNHAAATERIEEALQRNFKEHLEETTGYFQPLRSRVNKRLYQALGPALASRVSIQGQPRDDRQGRDEALNVYRLADGLDIEILE